MSERDAPGQVTDCHVFCRVVDNLGDIGVCWRLARLLAREHGWQVTLFVDDLRSFSRLAPALDASVEEQTLSDIRVRRWGDGFTPEAAADVVVEAFACELPDAYQRAMAARAMPPVWINLEYLSAEPWVESCHRVQSPHPRLPLVKHFFFPGFSPKTGGLLIERDLESSRHAFRRDPARRVRLMRDLGVDTHAGFTVFAFCYETAALDDLIEGWLDTGEEVQCLVAAGTTSRHVGRTVGKVTVRRLPYVAQEQFDALLWSVDFAIVRGEDSFVRAQLAAVPFAWHAYVQTGDTHLAKIDAFADRYCAGLAAESARAWRNFIDAWNRGANVRNAWRALRPHLGVLRDHAERWRLELAALESLGDGLARFAAEKLK